MLSRSKNPGWNAAVHQALLNWRLDCRRTRDYSGFAARSLSGVAVMTYGGCAAAELASAAAPVVVTLGRLDTLYASLDYVAPRRPYDMRAAERRYLP